MIEEEDDQEKSSAAIEEIDKYDSEDSMTNDLTADYLGEEKKEIILEKDAEKDAEMVAKYPDEVIREINEVVEAISGAVFQVLEERNSDKLGNRSSNTLGMRVKDSLILKVQQTQKKAMPFDGIRASQLACQLQQISCEDDNVRFLPSAPIESLGLSSESESLSTRHKKSVSLAEDVEVFNRVENEVFIKNEAGIVIGELMIDDRENDAETEDKICGFISKKRSDSITDGVSLVSMEKYEEISPFFIPINIAAEDVEIIEEETSRRNLSYENYSKNNLPSIQEMETGKIKDFQLVERRSSFFSSVRCSEEFFEILQENSTTFLNCENQGIQNLRTMSGDDTSLRFINVEEKNEVENLSIESSLEVDKSNPSLIPEIASSQQSSMFEINENLAPDSQKIRLQLAGERIPQITDDTNEEKNLSELLTSIKCIVENLDNHTEKLKEDEINEGLEKSNEDTGDELISDIEEEVQQLEPTVEEKENEMISDENEADNEPQEFLISSVKSIQNFEEVHSIISQSENRILEREMLIVDHISDEKSKNDNDEDIVSHSPDLDEINSGSLSTKISDEMNDEKISEELKIRVENSMESEYVVGEESSSTENAALLEDCDDRSVFKLMKKNFTAAIVEGKSLVKFAGVSLEQKHVKKIENFCSNDAGTDRKIEIENEELNDSEEENTSSDNENNEDRNRFALNLDDDSDKENEHECQLESSENIEEEENTRIFERSVFLRNEMFISLSEVEGGIKLAEKSSAFSRIVKSKKLEEKTVIPKETFSKDEKEVEKKLSSEGLSKLKFGVEVREKLVSDKKVNMETVPAEETNSSQTSWEKTLSKVSINRIKSLNEISEREKSSLKLFVRSSNSVIKLSRTESIEAITFDQNINQAIETLPVFTDDRNLRNRIEDVELTEEMKIRVRKKCEEKNVLKIIRDEEEEESKVENQTMEDSSFSLQSEKSRSMPHEQREEKTEEKSVEIEAGPLAVEIRKQNRERKTAESARKFANSLSRIFSNHSSRKRNVPKESSSKMKRQEQFEVIKASSNECEIEKKNSNMRVEENGEEFGAPKSLDSMNDGRKITNHICSAAAVSKEVKKDFSREDQEVKKTPVVESAKHVPEERLENSCSQVVRAEKKQRKSYSSRKSFATIRKFFSKGSTMNKNETEHEIEKQNSSMKHLEDEAAVEGNEVDQVEDQKQRSNPKTTKRVPDDFKSENNSSEVSFVDNSAASVTVNKVETNYNQQVSCPESREDKRDKLLSGVKSTNNSRSIDHLERVEMRTSDEKNPPDESVADSTTPSIEDGGKIMKKKSVSETESVFSRTMKRLFKKRGSAADSIASKPETRSVSSENDTIETGTHKSRKICTKESFQDKEFAVFDALLSDTRRNLINREEICRNLNDNENSVATSESESRILLLRNEGAKKSFDALTKAFHESNKRSTISAEDDIIESSSVVSTSIRNTFSTGFMTEDNPQGETTQTLTRDFESTPFGRRNSIIVMMATPDPPRKEIQPEASSTSNHQRESSSSSPTVFYYLLGPTLDEALLDVRAVFQKLIDKIAGRSK